MGLLKRLSSILTDHQLCLRMQPVNEGIEISLWKGKSLIPNNDLVSEGLQRRLPASVIALIKNYTASPEGYLLVPLIPAKQLRKSLQGISEETLLLDSQPLDVLQLSPPPADFEIRWLYNKNQKSLDRQLFGADRHLGGGWFQQNQMVWGPSAPLPNEMSTFLSKTKLQGGLIDTAVSSLIPAFADYGLRASTSLTIKTDIEIQVQIVKMLERSMDVQVTTNFAELLASIEILDLNTNDPTLISDPTLLPNLRYVLSPRLLQLARAKEVQRLSGAEMLSFIQDDLRPNAQRFGIEIARIDAKYQITDASQLTPSWQLEKRRSQGIGQYWAQMVLTCENEKLPMETLSGKIKNGDRFYHTEKGWIEFTPAFKTKLSNWVAKSVHDFVFYPREVLGSKTDRLANTKLSIPEIENPTAISEQDGAQLFMSALRDDGMPGAVLGLQTDIFTLIAQEAAELLKEYPRARILWNVSKRNLEKASAVLHAQRIAHPSSDPLRASGQVYLATPEQRLPLSLEWTWVIFHDLDVLGSSDDFARYAGQIKRNWTFATFTRPDWYAQRYIPQMMYMLQLTAEDLTAFRAKWVRSYTSQSESLLSRIASPFKRVIAPTSTDVGAVNIPPRTARVPPADIFRPLTNNLTVTVTQRSGPQDFVMQARQYVNRSESSAEFQPFQQYWPTYGAMNSAQQRWYFYWRTKLRQGEFLHTDLSYLFVHIYELINMIGFSDPHTAWEYFVKVWRYYRTLFPHLDAHLINWMADFAVIYQPGVSALDWYLTALNENAQIVDSDLAVEAWIGGAGHIDKLPDKLLYELANYHPTHSKFYQEYNASLQLDASYKKGLEAVSKFTEKQIGKALFDLYKPEQPRVVMRPPFGGAIYAGDGKTITIATVYPRTSSPQFSPDLSNIIKYTENVLRAQAKFKSKLRNIEISPEWAAAIDQAFSAQPARRELKIDMTSVSALHQESEEVRQRLVVEEPDEEPEQAPVVVPISADRTAIVAPATSPLEAIVGPADSAAAKILKTLQKSGWEATKSSIQEVLGEGYFLSVELDRINERAVEALGDTLIIEEGDTLAVGQDFRGELQDILDHDATPHQTAITAQNYEELGSELSSFAVQLKPPHWEALAVLMGGADDVNPQLDAIARKAYTTVNLLVEDINSFALNSLGDIVINTDGEKPAIQDENIEGLRKLVDWAATRATMEN